ncbi:hypothetical protein [Streptomyces sp. TR06-5]|uniref:hypothetical protein n=1 Tax=Streptomyces sp. TR06-5 TaxID=3385976 RepID=UPI0039A03132
MTDPPGAVTIEADLATGPLVDLWNVLLDLSEAMPRAWSLISGQMVCCIATSVAQRRGNWWWTY